MNYSEMNRASLETVKQSAEEKLAAYQEQKLNLDLTRGKPGRDQLDLADGMLTVMAESADCVAADGFDCRNYGILDGIPEAKKLFGDLLGINPENIIVGGNSSLNMMYDSIARLMIYGSGQGQTPYMLQGKVKFLCPAPGYDRHFAICQSLGIEMIPVEMRPDGPDMDAVCELVRDPSVKGIWCVPKFSNPDGITYSDAVVERLASMETAADDFRIFWDNAYAVHELADEEVPLADIFALSEKYGTEDRVYYFASTSKISLPGAGVAMMAASRKNIAFIKSVMTVQTIGHDKMNQLRHVKYFKDAGGIKAQMKRQAELIAPKFDVVLNAFRRELPPTGSVFTEPKGGYFVSLYVPDGCARRVYELAAEAGVKLTAAGAAFPYGKDPRDRHLRIAPTFPGIDDLRLAVDVLVECVKLAAAEKLLATK